MKVIYGKGSKRIDLTPNVLDLSWSSSRGQLSQVAEIRIKEAPALESAGFLMVFTGELKEKEQLFHGPIVRTDKDDKTSDLSATAYEISWYLQKNDVGRISLNGDAGKELERIIKGAGITFTCPRFGFSVKERASPGTYAGLYTSLTEKALDKTGFRYFLQHQREKLYVLPEGQNSFIPMFRAGLLERSSTGQSIEEVYTVVTVERYKDDKVVGSSTKENTKLSKEIGRMQKIIDAGEDKNLSGIASSQLSKLATIPITRSITVKHEDNGAAKIRAGWKIKILEKDNKTVTQWIVTSCSARWKGGQYTMDLQLERR